MFPNITVKEGAIFIADAHDCAERSFFYAFLEQLNNNPPPQLFLMGDMVDLLVGDVAYGIEKYKNYITLIDEIAKKTELFYLEGNHDFNLASLFKYARVFSIEHQPLHINLPDGTKALVSHGDKYADGLHRFFTYLIRNHTILSILNFLDKYSYGFISKAIEESQKRKNLCRKIENFQAVIEAKITKYPLESITWVIEGHYHQNCQFETHGINYFNFSSFACNQSYFSVQSSSKTQFAQMQVRGCNG
ncbi:MAG: UDP-2,3-diacylglucosamine diphosphatase [Sulfurospirillaceae bacterium]|nr:UDP-2,3-diacylglucosamine diphosphatase [Sulfurospirillaceae bacterium]